MSARERGGGGIQSLERAFAILEEVARQRGGIGLNELSKAVGLHTSTTFHLAKTMTQLGYLGQDPDSKRYRIGTRLFSTAAGALDESTLLALATPALESLSAATGEGGHFAIRSGHQIVVIARTAGSGMLQLVDRAGSTRPAHATALGKVLLAPLPDEQARRFLGETDLRKFTAKTLVEPAAILRELAEVRRKGIAYDDGEFDKELRCVAVPVYDFAGRVAGAIGVSGAVWRLSLQSLQEKAKQVREAAAALSAQLGFREERIARARVA